ncbi:MAG: hypothetical protein ACKOAH_11205, partial [Pirellula sp.]
ISQEIILLRLRACPVVMETSGGNSRAVNLGRVIARDPKAFSEGSLLAAMKLAGGAPNRCSLVKASKPTIQQTD